MDIFAGVFRNKDGMSVISGDFATFHSANDATLGVVKTFRKNVVHIPLNLSSSSTLTPLIVDPASTVFVATYEVTLSRDTIPGMLDITKIPMVAVSSAESHDVYFAVDAVSVSTSGSAVTVKIDMSCAMATANAPVTQYIDSGAKRIGGSYHQAFNTRTAIVPTSTGRDTPPALYFRLYFPVSTSDSGRNLAYASGYGLEFKTASGVVGFTTRFMATGVGVPFAPTWLNDLRAASSLASNVWATATLGGTGTAPVTNRFAIYSSNRLVGVTTGNILVYNHQEDTNWFGSGGVDEKRYVNNSLIFRRLLLAPPFVGGSNRVWYSDFPIYWSTQSSGYRDDTDGIGGMAGSSGSTSATANSGIPLKDNNASYDIGVYIP